MGVSVTMGESKAEQKGSGNDNYASDKPLSRNWEKIKGQGGMFR